MGQAWHDGGRAGLRPRVVARWLLLAAVLAGLFGMHVLTAHDGPGGDDALPQTVMTGHQNMTVTDTSMTAPAIAAAVGAPAPGPIAAVLRSAGDGFGGHGSMAACILFLVVGGVASLLALMAARLAAEASSTSPAAKVMWADLRRRGPPGRSRPRVALCVSRI